MLLISHRAHGISDGNCIGFGVHESRDFVKWAEFIEEKYPGLPVIFDGVSMGGATVMMSADLELPDNVKALIADCGYTSAEQIIKKVVKEMGLPVRIFYPFIKLGARIFGHFNLEETSPLEAMKKCTLPIVFVHGDTDAFVPYDMSVRLCEACASEKKTLITIKGAGHGLAFPVDRDGYVNALKEVRDKWQLK